MFISIPLIAASSILFVSTPTYSLHTDNVRALQVSSHQTGSTVYQKSSVQTGKHGSASVHITTIINGEKVVDIHETSTGTPLTIESVYPATSSVARMHVTGTSSALSVTEEALRHTGEPIRSKAIDSLPRHVPMPPAASTFTNSIVTEFEKSKPASTRYHDTALWTHFKVSFAQTIAYALSHFSI